MDLATKEPFDRLKIIAAGFGIRREEIAIPRNFVPIRMRTTWDWGADGGMPRQAIEKPHLVLALRRQRSQVRILSGAP